MKTSKKHHFFTLLAVFFTTTLFLTFSRGAIYSFVLALIVFIVYTIIRHNFSWRLITIPLAAFTLSLCAQGLFAQLSPTTDTFWSGVTKSIHQLTLGKIDLRPSDSVEKNKHNYSENKNQLLSNMPQSPSENYNDYRDESEVTSSASRRTNRCDFDKVDEDHCEEVGFYASTSNFSGYVSDSTTIRVNLTDNALSLWSSTPSHIIFGTGLGSAGMVLYENNKTSSPKEIIQNQYASLLLELGLIGALLATLPLITILRLFITSPLAPLLIPLCLAYVASLFFFAGLPNALHIYLIPSVLYMIP